MTSRVIESMTVSNADDLQTLLDVLREVLVEAGMSPRDMEVVLATPRVHVDIIENTLTDRSRTYDLKFIPSTAE